MKKKSFSKFWGKAFILLFVLQMFFTVAYASDITLSLYKNKESDNTPFAVADMLPGDYIKQDYCVRVSYNGTITVYFTADVRDGYEKLAEALRCKVVMPDKNLLLYDGPMCDIGNLPCTITGVNTTENLNYEIAVYLDTSVGNDYQDLTLIADFLWWVDTENLPVDPPGGGGGGGGGGGDPNPDDPDNPDNPPLDPDDPDNPIDPEHPDAPSVDPDDPSAPNKPINPDDPTTAPDGPAVNPDGTPKGELIDPPYTGDRINPLILIGIICLSLLIIFLIIFIRKKNKKEPNKIMRRLTICIAIIIVLAIALCITTFALVRSSMVSVEENIFNTGVVKININDEKPIIEEHEVLFEPGMTVRREFFVKNESTDSVYYKLYMDNVHGALSDVLEITIIDNRTGDTIFSGSPRDFTKKNAEPRELFLNEKRTFTVMFRYPETEGNSTQNKSMAFDMCAVATQMRNNPDKIFD